MKYYIRIACDLAVLLPSAGKRLDEVNKVAHSFGIPESMKLVATTAVPFDMTASRELTEAEIAEIKIIMLTNFEESFPNSKPQIVHFSTEPYVKTD